MGRHALSARGAGREARSPKGSPLDCPRHAHARRRHAHRRHESSTHRRLACRMGRQWRSLHHHRHGSLDKHGTQAARRPDQARNRSAYSDRNAVPSEPFRSLATRSTAPQIQQSRDSIQPHRRKSRSPRHAHESVPELDTHPTDKRRNLDCLRPPSHQLARRRRRSLGRCRGRLQQTGFWTDLTRAQHSRR